MFHWITEYLRILATALAILATSLSFFIILRKIIEDLSIARNSAVEILEETGAADIVFNKIITDNISDERTYSYFVDFVRGDKRWHKFERNQDVIA